MICISSGSGLTRSTIWSSLIPVFIGSSLLILTQVLDMSAVVSDETLHCRLVKYERLSSTSQLTQRILSYSWSVSSIDPRSEHSIFTQFNGRLRTYKVFIRLFCNRLKTIKCIKPEYFDWNTCLFKIQWVLILSVLQLISLQIASSRVTKIVNNKLKTIIVSFLLKSAYP